MQRHGKDLLTLLMERDAVELRVKIRFKAYACSAKPSAMMDCDFKADLHPFLFGFQAFSYELDVSVRDFWFYLGRLFPDSETAARVVLAVSSPLCLIKELRQLSKLV